MGVRVSDWHTSLLSPITHFYLSTPIPDYYILFYGYRILMRPERSQPISPRRSVANCQIPQMVHPQNAKDSPLQVVLKGQEVKINQVDLHISIKMVNQAEGKLGLNI